MRRVLLTGVTGFVGGAAACRLLRDARVEGLVLMVRASSAEHARARVTTSLARFAEPDEAARMMTRVTVVACDLLDARDALRDVDDVTHVLHAAADTSMRSVRGVRRTNVMGTMALAHRARRMPRVERFLHVSTAYACGAVDEATVPDAPPDLAREHVCEYTRSKAEAEWLLEHTAPDLPTVVARPSVVVGHATRGCAPSASIYWYYAALARAGVWPNAPDRRRDMVPVDYVADALHHLLTLSSPRARVYHLSAGERAEPWRDIAAALGHGPPREVTAAELVDADGPAARCLGGDARTLVALGAFARFSALPIEVFDNARLLAEGMAPPPRATRYLPVCAASVGDRAIRDLARDDL